MAILVPPETKFGVETWRWEHTTGETNPFDPSVKGMRPIFPQPYPAMLYKVVQKNPWKFESHVVENETEQQNMESRGFIAGGQGAAVDQYERDQFTLAETAAARNYEDRNLSANAKAESQAAEEASSTHLGEIPRTPIKPKGQR